MSRPRFSTWFALGVVAVLVCLLTTAVWLGRETSPAGRTVLTLRLWDQQVAAAYRESLAAFSAANPDIEVRVDVVAYAGYFDSLRTDVAGGSADDIFWISNAYFAGYADSGRLLPITPSPDWEPAVVDQFTRDQTLWGVPQLTDAGIALYYNAELLAQAGVDPADLAELEWGTPADSLRPLAMRLTVDARGRRAGQPGFDPGRIRQWGYNAANDLQGIYLNFIGSAGGTFSADDRFTFDNPPSATAFDYLVGLINTDHAAPPASATNDNGDFSRNQFLAGRMALFQSGTYNLANVAQAPFEWGVAMLPRGPAGRVSVTNGIVAAGNSATKHPEATRRVLAWLGSTEGNSYLGAGGAAIPAVRSAQRVYHDYWARRGVDVDPFFDVLDGPHLSAPGGTGFAAGFTALKPYFDEMFLGRLPVPRALRQAQEAANTAAAR
ncbi:sugar ABC transporter substrate-binding lipoprotein UspC [Mycolicibacterium chitae]|uniref:Carbohydrate ABC transporter substrate-binding protein, CUT1 family n=1 Tax=Mycolicibacterium chitae TaxID=1792 RepID=A0A3S4VAK1_MYCCI|nr:sugar ABC transporter substrate-binding protein [Mycolicibacterium chitae]MCV7106323.1 sugar ABC transporter substrate-binding protein [Mycolicibacterium chitae]BBZ03763.1 sugar ABC transporter substrate-binding lipoprotein UspC [Mycolicibacterium chitae]VEG47418.1 carbohydrate ABC transporter substrate-binding protein, CUT1 family [Mycolicibacterium chitae]